MIADLISDWSPHLRALWNDPLVWVREHWTFVLLAVISIAAVGWWLIGLLTTDEGRFCPGSRPAGFLRWRRILAWLWPINWVSHWNGLARCGYDLSRTPRDHHGHQTCPECGRRSTPASQIPGSFSLRVSLTSPRRTHPASPPCRKWLRSVRLQPLSRPRIFRRDVVAGLILLGCLTLWKSPAYRYSTYLDDTPDRIIILATRFLGSAAPEALEDQFFRRLFDPALAAPDAGLACDALVDRLCADQRTWNGWQAADALQHLLASPDSAIAASARAALDITLTHHDYQARQFAAAVLRRHIAKFPEPPSSSLIAATVEGLSADPLNERSSWVANAREGFAFLITHADRAAPWLDRALDVADPQGRWLAALIITRANLTDLVPRAAPILIAQLADNDISGDERIAADALRALGPIVIPLLTPHFESDDPQLRTWCGRIVREVREQAQGFKPAPILSNRDMLVYRPGTAKIAMELPQNHPDDSSIQHPAANAATKSR